VYKPVTADSVTIGLASELRPGPNPSMFLSVWCHLTPC